MPQEIDLNGFVTVRDNPISKVGVFPYLGKEINAPEPDRIYQVYRPESELNNPETIESFKLSPMVDDHMMLGDLGMPAEQKGVQGVIGENVYFQAPYLRGNLRIFSSALKQLIKTGKKDLSPGYISQYEFTPGTFDGQRYDAIQRNIRGNHLALVKEGRTGPDIAVQDTAQGIKGHFTITLDSMEVLAMPTTIEELMALIEAAITKALTAGKTGDAEVPPNPDPTKTAAGTTDDEIDEEAAASAAKAGEQAGEGGDAVAAAAAVVEAAEAVAAAVNGTAAQPAMDALATGIKAIATLVKTQDASIKSLTKKVATIDSGEAIVNNIAEAAVLYAKVTPFVGNFDQHPSSRTVQGIATYSCEKLGLKPAKGSELATLTGYLAAQDAMPKKVATTDSATTGDVSAIDSAWKGEK